MRILVENKHQYCLGLVWHENTQTPLYETVYRYGSKKYFQLFKEARELYEKNLISLDSSTDKWFMEHTDLGKTAMYEGKEVYLDYPLEEAEHQGKEVQLNTPKAGGPKKWYVYVKDGDSVRKVTFGDTTGLKVKIGNLEASKAFAARHKCDTEKDKTSANWWGCNLPKYAKSLGLSKPAYRYW